MKIKTLTTRFYLTGVAMAIVLSLFSVLQAQAADITQGYQADQVLIRGSIVALNPEDNQKVEAINADRAAEMYGIVIRSNDSAFTVKDDDTGVFVATSGRYEVLVSDANGPVKNGDYVSISSLTGIGQKAGGTSEYAVGLALQDLDFSNTSNILSQTVVTNEDGEQVAVSIGRILVDVSVGPNPNANKDNLAPEFLLKISKAVAGKPVSIVRIYGALAVFLVSSAIATSLVYSSIKSSIISIGRNPLSKKSVLTGLFQVIFIATLIFISGMIAVYLVLRI